MLDRRRGNSGNRSLETASAAAGSSAKPKVTPFVLAAVAAWTGIIAGGCGQTSAGGRVAAGGMQAMPVQVIIAKIQKIPDTTEYLSVLKSRHSAAINPQVEG